MLWILLALGGAMAIGNLLAIIRPRDIRPKTTGNVRPKQPAPKEKGAELKEKPDLKKAPVLRSVIMIVLGTAVAIWALASLLIS